MTSSSSFYNTTNATPAAQPSLYQALVNATTALQNATFPTTGIAYSTGTSWGTPYTTTGSGQVIALATSPTLVTPILGTPTSGTLTNCTGLSLTTGITGTLGVSNGGTGLTTLTTGLIPYGAGTGAFGSSANLFFDGTSLLRVSGNTTNPAALTNTRIHLVGANATQNRFMMDGFGAGNNLTLRASGGTAAAPSGTTTGLSIFSVNAFGYGSTGYSSVTRASFGVSAAETWTDAAQGTYWTFSTTQIGTTTTAERLRIDDAGNVGIGTSNPLAAFDIARNTATSTTDAIQRWTWSASTTLWGLRFDQIHTGSAIDYAFRIRNGTTTDITALYMQSTGNVGIGTSTPGAKLEVLNTILVSGSSTLYLRSGNNSISADASNNVIYYATGAKLFYTNAAERMRIDASGNVGIGTASPGAKLEVAGTFSIRTSYPTFAYLDTVAGASNGGFARFTANGLGTYIYQINTAVAGDFSTVINAIAIDKNGNVLNTGTGGLGYGTGSGGAVTQLTSRTTGVTLNKTNGSITLFSAAGVTTATTFTVTNSTVAATDVILVNQKSGTNLYNILVTAVAAGSFNITFYTTGGIATDAPVFNFAVIKAVTA